MYPPPSQCLEEADKCKLCCKGAELDGMTQCLVATDEEAFPTLQSYLNTTTAKLSPGTVINHIITRMIFSQTRDVMTDVWARRHQSSYIPMFSGSVCGGDMGYCDIFYVCRIVDADGPIASLGNYIFNGVLFETAQNIALEYWFVRHYCHFFRFDLSFEKKNVFLEGAMKNSRIKLHSFVPLL